MKTIKVSVIVNIQGDQDVETYKMSENVGRTLSEIGTTTKAHLLARLCNLLDRYDEYLKEKHKEFMAEWPPHSLFCEKRCCQRSSRSYWRWMKKELKWGRDDHLR